MGLHDLVILGYLTLTAVGGMGLAAVVAVSRLVRAIEGAAAEHSRQIEAMLGEFPVGGLPRELWLERHRLEERKMAIEERKFEIIEPLERAKLEAKLAAMRRPGRAGALPQQPVPRIVNPEA